MHSRRNNSNNHPDEDGSAGPNATLSLPRFLKLSRDTAMPFYQQIEEQIVQLIESGRIQAGATLPAERQLAEALGVSRVTVQGAYNRLRERGLIRGRGRHGSIVESGSLKLRPDMDRLRGFTQEMREAGRTASTRVLERQVVTDRSMASIFGFGSNAPFLRLLRVRLGDETPLSVESAWYSLDVAPGLEAADPGGSMYQHLAFEGLSLAYCDQTIEATLPSPAEMEALGLAEAVPCLLIKRRSYLRDDRMVEYVEGLFRGDAYTYRLRLNA